MKKVIITSLIVTMFAVTAFANPEGVCPNGKLIGKLNIIAAPKGKNVNMDNGGGSVIFVSETGKTKIYLYEAPEGESFQVLDKNGTDGDAAFQLPDPDLDPYLIGDPGEADTVSAYSVYGRPLGKPGGWAEITTCADLLDSTFAGLLPGNLVSILNRTDGSAYCSIEQVGQELTERKPGKSVFTNVTAELLTIVFQVTVDLDGDGIADDTVCVRVPIFDDILDNEYWEYVQGEDEEGNPTPLKLYQIRFYDCTYDVTEADAALTGC
jgi:hypothetical protein